MPSTSTVQPVRRDLRWVEQLVEIKRDNLLSPPTFLSWYFPEDWTLNSRYFKTNKTTKTKFSDRAKWSEVSQRLNKAGLTSQFCFYQIFIFKLRRHHQIVLLRSVRRPGQWSLMLLTPINTFICWGDKSATSWTDGPVRCSDFTITTWLK